MRRLVRHTVLGALGGEVVNRTPQDIPDTRFFAGATVDGTSVLEGSNTLGRGTTVGPGVTIGYATSIGSHSEVAGPLAIGRYCSLGPCFGAYGEDHGTGSLTTYNNHRLLGGELKGRSTQDPVVIGHGVWTGHGAIVLKGVTVGNGAVVGAGAVVTRDVAPYSVVVGNPARHVRFRFEPAIIERVEVLAWWERSFEELAELRALLLADLDGEVEAAVALLDQAIEQGRSARSEPPTASH